jgi:elongation factor P
MGFIHMFDTTELKKGIKIELEDKVFVILKSDHTNPGKGSAFVKCRLKNLETGAVIERTFKSGVSTGATEPELQDRDMEYLYNDTGGYNFMDQETYESLHLTKDQVGDSKDFLLEGIRVRVLYWKNRPISIEFPTFVNLKVQSTDPGLKGDTASGGGKKAIMETGLQITVPLFIKENELLKIDTRTREYVERVKS